MKRIISSIFFILISIWLLKAQDKSLYLDQSQPVEKRVADIISKMTLEEKVSQMAHTSPGIPRLGIPAYNWWSEALHGVARSGVATVYPQAIGLAATFDTDLVFREANAISDEARAMYNAALAKGYHQRYGGLTFWSPNINIFRDPRWGRGQETYGEDPFLTSQMGVQFVKGLQGNDPKYLKVAACAKHFAVHSGPERLRHEFNAVVSDKDLYETYLPSFKALVDAKVEAVMCAYNSTNNFPCCSNNYLISQVLRKKWGFKGHVVSDCWALVDIYQGHKETKDVVETVALAVKEGVNLNCGDEYDPNLAEAVKKGLISEGKVDSALAVLYTTRFKLGMFDPQGSNPYDKIPPDVINCTEHRMLAREAALKSVVMLKNNGVLPLRNDMALYFVTGVNATSVEALLGNYYGVNNNYVTILEGLCSKISTGSQLQYLPGCLLDRANVNPIDWTTGNASNADATIVVLGITGLIEGEEGESIASPNYGDRLDYNIPQNQIDFLEKLREKSTKPLIVVITGGSPMNLAEVHEIADAVLLVWYPGEEGGNAVASIIFGETSPSGKLPVTFPKSLDQLPAYEDYNMTGRTYRYMQAEPMYPFGFGLSYGKFEYSNITMSAPKIKKTQSVDVEATVTNTGKFASEEVVQLYITDIKASVRVPLFSLKGFKRIKLNAGEQQKVKFTITPDMLNIINEKGESILESGDFKISISGSLPGSRTEALGGPKAAEIILTVK